MTSSLPVLIDEEAARRIAGFQIEREMDRMIAWAQENVPDLLGIRVAFLPDRRPEWDKLVIWAYWECDDRRTKGRIPEWEFIDWKLANFPFEVAQKVSVWCTPGPVGSRGV